MIRRGGKAGDANRRRSFNAIDRVICDYSLSAVKTRDAAVDDKLVITNFNTGTRGFAPVGDCGTAVCVRPGTEIAFDENVKRYANDDLGHKVAIFRQVHKDQPHMHHDTLEFPDGTSILLTYLVEGQTATILQLPAAPKTAEEAEEQRRVEVVA